MKKSIKAKKQILKASNKRWLSILSLPLIFTLFFIIFRQLQASLFFQNKDRINLVFYGKNTTYYSLGKSDSIHYFISFYPDVKIKVPGGYGNYRIGALGKLVNLEHNNDLFRKAFSVTTASSLDRFFYQNKTEIFYGKDQIEVDSLHFPSAGDIFFSSSNSNIFDRIYIFIRFFGKRSRQFAQIDFKRDMGLDEEFFQDKDFAKKYQGILYNRIYREEQKTVQIIYHSSYKTALFLSKIIEGDGIRVVDISQGKSEKGDCEIVENGENFSVSAKDLASFYGCTLKNGQTDSSDIIIKLGLLEKEWEIL
ncbi:MAG: hypothetical protein WC489_03665 [Patescibacteria group bacterium]